MSYNRADGRYVDTDSTGTLFATQTGITGSGSTTGQDSGGRNSARLTLNVTAVSGSSPTLTVNIQGSPDNSTWTTIASFSAATAVSTASKNFAPLDRYVRAQWGAPGGTGTPTFTFNLTGDLI